MRFAFTAKLGPHMQEVVRGSAFAFTGRTLGVALEFGFSLILARVLGAEGAGFFFLAFSVTSVAAVLGRLGLDLSLVRFIAGNAAVGDWAAAKGVYEKSLSLTLATCAVLTLLMFVTAPWLASSCFHKPELTAPLRWMALAVIPVALQSIHAQALKGLKRVFAYSLIEPPGLVASGLALSLIYFLGRSMGALGAVLAYVLASVGALVTGIVLWKAATPQMNALKGKFPTNELLASSMPLLWFASMNLLTNWTSTFVLGVFGTTADVGIFNAAARTAMLTSFILITVNGIVAPKFAELFRLGDYETLRTLPKECTALMTLLAAPVLLIFVFCPGWVMGWFGPQFAEEPMVLVILALGQFVNVGVGSVGQLLVMSGHERLLRNTVTMTGALSLASNLALIPFLGVYGAAASKTISVIAFNLVSVYLVWKILKIQTIPLGLFGFKNLRQIKALLKPGLGAKGRLK